METLDRVRQRADLFLSLGVAGAFPQPAARPAQKLGDLAGAGIDRNTLPQAPAQFEQQLLVPRSIRSPFVGRHAAGNLIARQQRRIDMVDALRQRIGGTTLNLQALLDIGAFLRQRRLDIFGEGELPDNRRDPDFEILIRDATALERFEPHLDRPRKKRSDDIAMPADAAFGMQENAMPFQRPGDRVFLGSAAVAGYLGDQIVGQPEFLHDPAEAVDDAMRGPGCRERTDPRDDLLVDHPVGEEFRMVGRDERCLACAATGLQPLPVVVGKVDMADIGDTAQSGHAVERQQVAKPGNATQHDDPVDDSHDPDQRRIGRRRHEHIDFAQPTPRSIPRRRG
ncbi:hypothetical protein [Mesorhizobium sp. L48C026A00]|uniref:hypothetical protein n=1 Tax=Mesorhizobium sp. L48C026A00 TaxID=1287182 RepID=UPI001FD95E05|nr:hypothetical protein [Mesorhizobium sp. L48C026A00]